MSKNATTPPAYPEGDAGEIGRVFSEAARAVLANEALWQKEASRAEREEISALPWPLDPQGRSDEEQLLQYFAAALVQHLWGPTIEDAAAWDFQLLLRMVKRATDAGSVAIRKRFGGTGRISIKRDIENFHKLMAADAAIRSGLPRDEAFKQAGISRAGAYRHLKRKT